MCELGILNTIIHIIVIQIIDIYIMMGKICAKFKIISNESVFGGMLTFIIQEEERAE